MKHLLLAILISFAVHLSFGQAQRLVLLEEFTSSTCGPCAGVNPTFHTWQLQNPDKFTSIYYHVNWPSPGDPMNLANPQENGARVSYYGVTYVPQSNLDGNYYNGSASGWSMSTVNSRYNMPSPVEVAVQHWLSPGEDSVYSTMLVKCLSPLSGTLIAHNVIIEKWIHFNFAPGSNGEKDFYNVMKKMLPNQNGTQLPTELAAGDYYIIEGAWKFGTVYDKTQIAAVGFVQNKNTKEIFNTANSSVDQIDLPYDNDLEVMEINNIPSKTCKNKITPVIRVRNNGANTVTSMTIKYRVNDGQIASHSWSGSLGSLKKATITLPEYEYSILSSNDLVVYTTNPNSVADEYPKNDTLHFTMVPAPVTTNTIKLVLRTDNNPAETSWEFRNSLGQVVQASPVYSIPNKLYQETYTMPEADCYTFTIFDAGGNGICCSNGTGVYEISSNGVVIKQGGAFASAESSEFLMAAPVGLSEINTEAKVNVFPNPASGELTVSISQPIAGNVTLKMISAVGKLIINKDLGWLNSGTHETKIDVSDIPGGVYLVQVESAFGKITKKVSVVR